MPPTSLQLEHLLSPTRPEAFFRDSWEKSPLAITRSKTDHFAGLLSLRDVDQIIAFSRPKFADHSVFETESPMPATYVRGLLDLPAAPTTTAESPGLAKLRQVFDGGKSVVIMGMQERWPPVAELCRNLEGVFHCPVHANMYLTPAGCQGFAAHFDPHDVFILQLEGVKHWRLYDWPEVLPLASDKAGVPRLPLGTSREVCLHAGDLLYIPRGHVHEAFTSDSFSLHLTVGINVYRWADLLQHAVTSASRLDHRFRGSIPGGALPVNTAELKQQFQQLLSSLSQSTGGEHLFDEALRLLSDQFFGQLRMLPGSQFAAATGLDRLDLDTLLEKNPPGICRVIAAETGVAIEFPGNRVAGPHRIAAALRFIARTERFSVRELPDDLSSRAKVVLVRRLIREGLLTIVASPDPFAPSEQLLQQSGDVER